MDRTGLFKVRNLVYGARVIVTRMYGSLQAQSLWCKGNCKKFVWQFTGTVYGARGIVTGLYGSLHGQRLWCKRNCNRFVWQFTWTEFMVLGEM